MELSDDALIWVAVLATDNATYASPIWPTLNTCYPHVSSRLGTITPVLAAQFLPGTSASQFTTDRFAQVNHTR
jgi:hypothetical protein